MTKTKRKSDAAPPFLKSHFAVAAAKLAAFILLEQSERQCLEATPVLRSKLIPSSCTRPWTAALTTQRYDVPAFEVIEGVRVSRGLTQLDNIIDALWVVIIHKSLAARSVQRTEGAAERRLSQNTTFDGLQAQDLNPQQDRGGSLHVCVGDDSLTNLLSLPSTRISCAGRCRICPASTAFCQAEALCQRTGHRHCTSLGL